MLQTPAPLPAAAAPAPAQPQLAFSFHGTALPFFALMLKNMLLTVITLGIYLPWAKTERRKYLWQNIEIHGHRLRYHGTGRELFFGYLKVVLGYAVFVGVPAATGHFIGKQAGGVVQFALALVLLPLIPFVIWGSRRYLLSRTSWRGVHFRLEGGAGEFAKVFLLGYLFAIFSLGLYAPVWLNRIHRVMTNGTALGTRSFEYRGEDKVVFRMGLKGFFLSLLTLGIYFFWYRAELTRYQLQNTWFDGAHGEFDITGGDLLKLTLLQIFALTCSLGLAFPWVATYSFKFTLSRLRFKGPVDFGRIYQAQAAGSAAADGLADVMDVGIGL